ncbi:MAG: peptidylprolyl isomerase [Chloroflexi bacterium]|nr:peptidylprolyl isomerase [Chloroflexota bacterium]
MRSFLVSASLALLLSACSGTASILTPTAKPTVVPSEVVGLPEFSCTAVTSAEPQSDQAGTPLAQVSETDWVRGPADAAVTLIEYSDFQCPFCAQLAQSLAQLEAQYPDDLRVVYRHFPLIGSPEQPLHEKAALSMQAAEAAGRQGKFWEMHDALFNAQNEWTGMGQEDFETWLLDSAGALELDVTQFSQDLHSDELAQMAQDAWVEGQENQIPYTPYIFINGNLYTGPTDANSLEPIIQLEALSERQFHECPQMILEPGAGYTATLQTEKGDIVIALFPEVAPMAVNSFVFLAQNDWFDNVTFHRVLPGFVAQAGDPSGTGYGSPGYSFAIEVDPELTFDRAGLLAMANSGPTSNGSQFFITLGPAEHLNGQFTIFGEVIQGMDVAESLTPRDPTQAAGLPPGDLILDVSIEVH